MQIRSRFETWLGWLGLLWSGCYTTWTELAEHLYNLVQHPNQSKPNQVSKLLCHPVKKYEVKHCTEGNNLLLFGENICPCIVVVTSGASVVNGIEPTWKACTIFGRAISGSDSSTRSFSMTSASMMVASMWLNFNHFSCCNNKTYKLYSQSRATGFPTLDLTKSTVWLVCML